MTTTASSRRWMETNSGTYDSPPTSCKPRVLELAYQKMGNISAADRDYAKSAELESMVTAEERASEAARAAKRVAAAATAKANSAAATATVTAEAKR